MKNKFIQTALVATMASLALANGPAAAAEFLDFTIDEGSVPGALDNEIIGDKLNGGYEELLTVNADFSFDTTAVASFGQVFADQGSPPAEITQLGCLGDNCYNMYAIFDSSGVFSGGNFTGTSGEFNLYIDPDQDTTFAFGADGTVTVATTNDSDDYLIAFASNVTSLVGIVGDPGAFDFVWDDFALTSGDQNAGTAGDQNGELYFIYPVPFYMTVNVDGDFDNFVVEPGNIELTGDVSAVFVPEPTTLALLGMGLAGLGMARRKKA